MYKNAVSNPPPTPAPTEVVQVDEAAPNLDVIYQAFGEQADLYKDVLQVKPSSTAEQIQMAYFDRRSELFALLASIDSEQEQDDITASHRFHAERKMDAVVMAVRILGDPELRQEYDTVMALRHAASKKKQPREPPSCSASRASSREPDGVYAGVPHDEMAPPPSPVGRKSPGRRSPRRMTDHQQPDLKEISNSSSSSGPGDHENDDDLEPPLVNNSNESRLQVPPPPPSPTTKHKKKHHKNGKHSSSKKEKKSKKKEKKSYQPPPPPVDQSIDQSTLPPVDDDTYRDNTTLNDTLDEGTLDEGTVASWSTYGDTRRLTRGGTSTLSHFTNQGFVSKIQEEVAGTVEDTLVSFEQVLNVFTLQEKDILAVMGRIDKAKRQLKKRR